MNLDIMKKINLELELKILFMLKKINKKFFENLTMAPIDKDLIDQKILNKNEKKWINNYHKKVFKNLKNL